MFLIARLALQHSTVKYNIEIPWGAQIGLGLRINHCCGIVVSVGAQVGANCTICHNVTLGKAERGKNKGYPTIGDNVYLGPGAKVVGAVRIGGNVAIGANAVVTHDIPEGAVAVGIPARVISYAGAGEYVQHGFPSDSST